MFAAIVFSLMVAGAPLAVDQYNKGNIPGPAPEAKTVLVKATGGNYSYSQNVK